MKVMALHAFGHDTGACVMTDDHQVLITEERLSREKHDSSFPYRSIEYCLEAVGATIDEMDAIVYDGQMSRYERERLQNNFTKQFGWWDDDRVRGIDHHLMHAWTALAFSVPDDALVVVADGRGSTVRYHRFLPKIANAHPGFAAVSEPSNTTVFRWSNGQMTRLRVFSKPPGIGVVYENLTQYLGMGKHGGGKTMGLAAYATRQPKSFMPEALFTRVQHETNDFEVDWHPYINDVDILEVLFDRPRNTGVALPDDFYTEIAGFLQDETERYLLGFLTWARTVSPAAHLVLSGGVAMNCKANGRIEAEKLFESHTFTPAASDAGLMLGGALYAYDQLGGDALGRRRNDLSLGRHYSADEVSRAIAGAGDQVRFEPSFDAEEIAAKIARGGIFAVFDGGSECGARALGNRSIIADSRRADSRDVLNARVKKRESWRPFGPIVFWSDYDKYFVGSPADRRWMNCAADVRPKMLDAIPACVHADNTARPQVLADDSTSMMANLLRSFRDQTGVGVLINTSFNLAGEPIVETPQDAMRTLLNSDLDGVAFESGVAHKNRQ